MSLTGVSPLVFGLGLVGLAGLLVVLQILRVRHAPIAVVTTLFWQEALQEARARVFRRVFRHWPAWLLVFAICALLWTAFARPERRRDAEERTVLVLDASAGMQRAGRFAAARAALQTHARAAAAASSEVLVDAGGIVTLLAPGEDRLLLDRRLEGLAPVAAPSGLRTLLRQLAAETTVPLHVRLFGDAWLAPDAVPEGVTVERVDLGPSTAVPNAGITALGIAEAASGAPDRIDLRIEVQAGAGAAVPTPQVTWAGARRVPTPAPSSRPGVRVWTLEDEPARGGWVEVALPSTDGVGFDDEARLALPRRPRIRVRVAEPLASVLEPVLAADPQLEPSDGDADVVVGAPDAARPALVLHADRTQAAIVVSDPAADAEALLHDLYGDLGLAAIDGAALAEATGRVIDVDVRQADSGGRQVALWRGLLEPSAGLVSSRAFPLFLARVLRWLAGHPAHLLPYVAAGEPVHAAAGAYRTPSGARAWHPVGEAFRPPLAGRYVAPDGTPLSASLLDPDLVREPVAGASVEAAGGGASVSVAGWLLGLALLLLGCEWFLFRTGRMP